MNRIRWLGVAGGIVAVVAVVAILVTSAFAQTPTPTPTAKASGNQYGQVFLGKLAALLGIDQAKLVDAIKQAASETVDQAVQDGKLTQDQANRLKSRIQSADPSKLGFGHFGMFMRGHGKGPGIALGADIQQAIAAKLGLTIDQLRQELRSGKTIAQIAQEKGITLQDLGKAVVDAVKPKLDQAVKDGRLTQQQEDQIVQQLSSGNFLLGKWHPFPKGRPFSAPAMPTPQVSSS